ncbi:MAG TPA: endolytic transglycosylase MltG [Coxiellaceae bacterium]|nr:endolytic transglycosylase MltG [Coxiellaceae bacterium]
MGRQLHKTFLFSLLIFLLASLWFITFWYYQLVRPMGAVQEESLIVYRGDHITNIAAQLHERHLLPYPRLLIGFSQLNGEAYYLKTGEYSIKPDTSPLMLLADIVVGHVRVHTVRFLEGWTFQQMRETLDQAPLLQHTTTAMKPSEIMQWLGAGKEKPEGYFFPDTYNYVWGDSDKVILSQAHRHMEAVLQQEWDQRQVGLPYRSSYSALIVASMIEKETAEPSERSEVARVMLDRLKKHIRLAVDPTVVYGINKPYGYLLTKKDLASQSPYNTYRHYGLPPTPISMPSQASIHASLHPAESRGFLFYVSQGNGTHHFSKTYAEHLQAIKKYILGKST